MIFDVLCIINSSLLLLISIFVICISICVLYLIQALNKLYINYYNKATWKFNLMHIGCLLLYFSFLIYTVSFKVLNWGVSFNLKNILNNIIRKVFKVLSDVNTCVFFNKSNYYLFLISVVLLLLLIILFFYILILYIKLLKISFQALHYKLYLYFSKYKMFVKKIKSAFIQLEFKYSVAFVLFKRFYQIFFLYNSIRFLLYLPSILLLSVIIYDCVYNNYNITLYYYLITGLPIYYLLANFINFYTINSISRLKDDIVSYSVSNEKFESFSFYSFSLLIKNVNKTDIELNYLLNG